MTVLLLFLVILNIGIVSHQRNLLIDTTNDRLKKELDYLSHVTIEKLLKHDYDDVRKYLERWIKGDDSISEVKAVTPNGFVLAEHKKPVPSNAGTFRVIKHLQYEETDLAKFEVLGNYSEVEVMISDLNKRFIVASLFFVIIMGIALWYSQKKIVLVPMEMEIARRREAEEALRGARNELEKKVDERTAELKGELVVRSLAEEALRESEEQVRLLLNSTAEAIYGIDTKGRCTFCNPATLRILGFNKEEDLLGKNMHELIHHTRSDGSVYPREKCRVYDAFSSSAGAHVDDEVFWRKDGSSVYVEYWSHPIVKEGITIGAVVNFYDITKRKQAEEALLDSWEKYSRLFESANDSIFIVDPSSERILDANENAAKRLGYIRNELLRMSMNDIELQISDDRRAHIMRELAEKGSILYEHTHRRKGGAEMPVEISCQLIVFGNREAHQMFVRDITERKKLERELIKAEKLESLGVLAGGLAHDLNNLLTGIMGNISLAKMYVRSPEKALRKLDDAERAALRTRDLNLQLLTFSKGGTPVMKATSIGQLIKETADFALSGSNVRCLYDVTDDLWTVEVDEGQMSQVINNIIINADQAMLQGGIIEIKCENISVHRGDNIPLSEGDYVRISIRDEGTGIPEEQIRRIFDPYFTTKQRGSGLGLASAFSIVRKHHGYIHAESAVGSGSVFSIYLPASLKSVESKDEGEEAYVRGEEKILVMDDEVLVRDVAGDILSGLGYSVDFAMNGGDAIDLYKEAMESGEPFDAVIMDLTVPGGMGGEEAIKELLEIDPAVKAIVSSGYSNDMILAEYKKYGFSGVVIKPYKIQDISRALQGVLKNRKPTRK